MIVLSLLPLVAEARGPSDADDATAGALRYRPAAIAWAPCADDASLGCGTLRLPVDYRSPRSGSFDMAVIRARASEPARRIGVIMTDPGGPGFSGVDLVLGGVGAPSFARIRTRFDIVGFDRRGVGRSHPVRCQIAAGAPPSGADDAGLAFFFDDLSRRYAQACQQQNGPFVAQLGTNNVARDMDVLRRALGEQRITYASGSYGSGISCIDDAIVTYLLEQRLPEPDSSCPALPISFERGAALRGSRDVRALVAAAGVWRSAAVPIR